MTQASHLLHPLKLTVVGFTEEAHDYHFQAEAPDPTYCPHCAVIGKIVKFGKQDQSYRDVPIHGKRVTIWLVRRRYRCDSCEATFRPELADMDDRRMMTKRLAEYVKKQALVRNNSDVGREVGIEEKTVRSIFMDFYTEQNALYKVTAPKVLGIDELYLGSTYRAIFTNIGESTVIELLANRNKPTVVNFLSHLPKKADIETVCIDMWNPYRDAARQVLPQATVVVDKFHITRMANEAMDTIRKSIKGGLNVKQRRTLKGDRKLLLMRQHDLEPFQQLIMDTWLNSFPALKSAHGLKEGFYGVWDAKDEKEAKDRFAAWKATITDDQAGVWDPAVTAMTNWENEIFAYFRPGHQHTNAFTESSNRGIKDRQRDTRGMKFETYRAKILFSQVHKVVKPKPRKESPFGGPKKPAVEMMTGMPNFSDADFWAMLRAPSEVTEVTDFGVPISTVLALLESGEL